MCSINKETTQSPRVAKPSGSTAIERRQRVSTQVLKVIFLRILLCAVLPISSQAQDYLPVVQGRLVNVKDFNAKGDGLTDDTAAIQNCIKSTCGSTFLRGHIIYFPNGTYMITNQLQWIDSTNGWRAYLCFRGQSTTGAVIRLAVGATTFNSASSPKAMILTASDASTRGDGGGNTAFGNDIVNLTLDVGTGHAGAMGIDYNANNQGRIENVTILANDPTHTGFAGLYLGRPYPGPCLIKNLEVQGFNYGILCTNQDRYGVTLSGITLKNQKVAGLQNDKQVVTIENLHSDQAYAHVSTLRQDGSSSNGLVTLIGATCLNGTSANKAIALTKGHAYVRQVTTDGSYGATLLTPGGTNVTGSVNEWYSDGSPKSLYASHGTSSLWLENQPTPDFQEADSNKWVCVTDFGANGAVNGAPVSFNNSACFQAAIDSTKAGGSHAGATVVYVPYGIYTLEGPVYLRGNVRKLVGFGAHLVAKSGCPTNQALIQFTSGTTNDVTLDGFLLGYNYWQSASLPDPTIKIDTTNTITLKHLNDGNDGSYMATANARDLFVEDVYNQWWDFYNTQGQVWARQLDPENQDNKNSSHYHIHNHGAALWILGLKSEGWGDVIDTDNGGATELLGGLTFVWAGTDNTVHAFTSTNSSTSLVYAMNTDGDYPNPIGEYRSGAMQWLAHSSLISRGSGSVVPLFVGFTNQSVAAPGSLIWRGAGALTNWDMNSSVNWYNGSAMQGFADGSDVTFDDTASAFSPNLTAVAQPNSVTFDSAANYTLNGSGSLSGSLALSMNGSGTVVINTSNSFTGGVWINNGIAQAGKRTALGGPNSTVYIDGGTLDLHGVQGLTNASYQVQGTGYTNGGAIQNFGGSAQNQNGILSLTLLGDTTLGATSGRWDVYGTAAGSTGVQGNGFNLTKIGAQPIWFINGGSSNGLRDITIVNGVLGFQENTSFGDQAGTITVSAGATLSTYKILTNLVLTKTLVLSNAFFNNSMSNVTFGGPVTLLGANTQNGGVNETAADQAIFDGPISGPGCWIKSDVGIDVFNAANTFTGATVVSNGSVVLGPNGSLASLLIVLGLGTALDATALLNGWTLGDGQTLAGNGAVLAGNVSLASGATLALGAAALGAGTLTMTGNLLFQPGSTNVIKVNKTTTLANDKVIGLASVAMGGTLVVSNLGSALASGDAIPLFSAANYRGTFSAIIPLAPGPGLAWDISGLSSSGILRVALVNSTALSLSVQQAGSQLTLSWPADHTGWQLQVQSNSVAVGLSTNWVTVAGSTLTNRMTLPLAGNDVLFLRMAYPQSGF